MDTLSSVGNIENKSKIFRRSIFITKNIKKGEKFSKDNMRVIRPGFGLAPKYYNMLLNNYYQKHLQKIFYLCRKYLFLYL